MRTLADDERIHIEVGIARQRVRTGRSDVRPLQGALHAFDGIVDRCVLPDVVDILPGRAQDQPALDLELVGIRHAVEGAIDGAFREQAVMERLLRQHVVGRFELARHQIHLDRLREACQQLVEELQAVLHVLGVEGAQRQRAHVLLLLRRARSDGVPGDDEANDVGRVQVLSVGYIHIAVNPLLEEIQRQGGVLGVGEVQTTDEHNQRGVVDGL